MSSQVSSMVESKLKDVTVVEELVSCAADCSARFRYPDSQTKGRPQSGRCRRQQRSYGKFLLGLAHMHASIRRVSVNLYVSSFQPSLAGNDCFYI